MHFPVVWGGESRGQVKHVKFIFDSWLEETFCESWGILPFPYRQSVWPSGHRSLVATEIPSSIPTAAKDISRVIIWQKSLAQFRFPPPVEIKTNHITLTWDEKRIRYPQE